jgi:hypothetical protein
MAGRGVTGKGWGWQNWVAVRKGWLSEEGGWQKSVATEICGCRERWLIGKG